MLRREGECRDVLELEHHDLGVPEEAFEAEGARIDKEAMLRGGVHEAPDSGVEARGVPASGEQTHSGRKARIVHVPPRSTNRARGKRPPFPAVPRCGRSMGEGFARRRNPHAPGRGGRPAQGECGAARPVHAGPSVLGILRIAYKLLVNDKGKFAALLMGLTFSVFLMVQMTSMFAGMMKKASATVTNTGAKVWVMDRAVTNVSSAIPLPDYVLDAVRSIEGVKYAVPLYSGGGARSPRRTAPTSP